MRPPPLDLIKAYITRYDIMAFYCFRNENIVICRGIREAQILMM